MYPVVSVAVTAWAAAGANGERSARPQRQPTKTAIVGLTSPSLKKYTTRSWNCICCFADSTKSAVELTPRIGENNAPVMNPIASP